ISCLRRATRQCTRVVHRRCKTDPGVCAAPHQPALALRVEGQVTRPAKGVKKECGRACEEAIVVCMCADARAASCTSGSARSCLSAAASSCEIPLVADCVANGPAACAIGSTSTSTTLTTSTHTTTSTFEITFSTTTVTTTTSEPSC